MSTATTVVKDKAYTGQTPINTQPRDSNILEIAIPINFPLAAPVANDIHLLCKLLPGVRVVDWAIRLADLDSNGSPTASMSLGEANAALTDITVLYKAAIIIGQTGGLLRDVAASAAADILVIGAATLASSQTAGTERHIGLKWDTASATYVASTTGMLIMKLAMV